MCGAIEVGTCEVCQREEVQLERTYFHYNIPGIKCSCHSPDHFILIRHCPRCVPKEPEYTKIEFRTDDLKRFSVIESPSPILSPLTISNVPGVIPDVSTSHVIDGSHIVDNTISIKKAMEVLTKALSEDKSEGSYYYGWQSNIACAIMDNSDVDHQKANIIAKKFLDLLCK
jgi:hypothetical protein